MALVDLDTEVKPWLEISPSDTTSDDVLQLCMEAATEYFESTCNRTLEEDSFTQQFNGNGTHVLMLRDFPITDVTAAAIDSDWVFATPLDVEELLVDNELFVVKKDVWAQGIRNIQVSYSAGYTADDVPEDLRMACLQMIEFLYHGRGDHRLGVTSRNKIGESLTFQDAVPKGIKDLLAPYMRRRAVAALVRRMGG